MTRTPAWVGQRVGRSVLKKWEEIIGQVNDIDRVLSVIITILASSLRWDNGRVFESVMSVGERWFW